MRELPYFRCPSRSWLELRAVFTLNSTVEGSLFPAVNKYCQAQNPEQLLTSYIKAQCYAFMRLHFTVFQKHLYLQKQQMHSAVAPAECSGTLCKACGERLWETVPSKLCWWKCSLPEPHFRLRVWLLLPLLLTSVWSHGSCFTSLVSLPSCLLNCPCFVFKLIRNTTAFSSCSTAPEPVDSPSLGPQLLQIQMDRTSVIVVDSFWQDLNLVWRSHTVRKLPCSGFEFRKTRAIWSGQLVCLWPEPPSSNKQQFKRHLVFWRHVLHCTTCGRWYLRINE